MDHDAQRIRLAALQFGMSIGLVAAAVFIGASAHGQTSIIGRTWPIAEPDALAEIEARAARQPPSIAERFGPREGWSAMKSAALGVAVSTVRTHLLRLFEKTGTHRQADLAALLASFSLPIG